MRAPIKIPFVSFGMPAWIPWTVFALAGLVFWMFLLPWYLM